MNQFGAGPSQPTSSEALFPGFPTLDLSRLVSVVWKRLWLALLVAGAFLGLALLYVFTATKIYRSSAVIYIDPPNEGAVFEGIKGARQASWETLDALKSMADGIRNGTVILRVVDQLGLRQDPHFLPARAGGYSDAEIVEIVSKQVETELRRGTRLIDVSVEDRSPERARDMTAAFIAEFQELIREQNRASAEKARATLEEESVQQLERVNAAEEKLQEFRRRHADIALSEKNGITNTKLEDLDKLLSAASNEVLLKRAEFEQYQGIPAEEIERVLEIGSHGGQEHIQKILLARSQKRAEFVRIQTQFEPTHPTYQAYEADLAGLEEQVVLVARGIGESIEKGYHRAVEHEKTLRETVQEQKLKLIEVDGVMKEFRTLQRAVEAASTTYERLLDRINDTEVTDGVDETIVRTFSEPLVPAKPVSPKKTITVAAAGVFGTLFGFGFVIVLGLLDRSLHTRKQVESTLGLSVLAEIPRAFDREWELEDSLFVTRDPGSLVSESFRSLRTSLSAHAPRSVMITSPSPGEGKSFCAANLAVLQANMGYRTLLVDADFCKPRMAGIFVDPLHGKAPDGALTNQNMCQKTVFKNLHLLSCGRFTSNTGEPMSSEIFANMLHEAYASFDCVIIDTSPINVVSDGLTYSRHADAVVLVVKADETHADSARRAMRELQRMRAPLVGVVLNGVQGTNRMQAAYVEGTTRALPSVAAPGYGSPVETG
ncbi:MAG: polysaccharide biosynthesis tyrosine autokinase [Verrucomicrobiaceae bacterium]|nr:polysaccharide biosynthesis tyrosine autokinase [Verrucomicrobiaceae bacterium]